MEKRKKKSDYPLYLEIYEYYKNLILLGRMKPGEKLPSIRRCALERQVSKTTIESSYMQLAAEGYIEAVAGRLAAEARTAGTTWLPAKVSVITLKMNSPTRLKAIPETAPKIAYCILIEIFLMSKQVTSKHIPKIIEKIYKNGLITSCFGVPLIVTTSNTLPAVVAITKKIIPTIRKNADAMPKKRIGDFASLLLPLAATKPVKKPIPNLSEKVI